MFLVKVIMSVHQGVFTRTLTKASIPMVKWLEKNASSLWWGIVYWIIVHADPCPLSIFRDIQWWISYPEGKKLLFKPYLCIMMPLYSHMHCYALLEGHIQTIKLLFLSGGNMATVGFAYSFHISDQRPFLHNFYKQKNPGLKPGVVVWTCNQGIWGAKIRGLWVQGQSRQPSETLESRWGKGREKGRGKKWVGIEGKQRGREIQGRHSLSIQKAEAV